MIKDYIIVKNAIFPLNQQKKLEKIHIPLCTDNKNALTIMPKKNKNEIIKSKDFHMQTM